MGSFWGLHSEENGLLPLLPSAVSSSSAKSGTLRATPTAMLWLWLAWPCAGLSLVVLATVSSCVPCRAQQILFCCRWLLPVALQIFLPLLLRWLLSLGGVGGDGILEVVPFRAEHSRDLFSAHWIVVALCNLLLKEATVVSVEKWTNLWLLR